ncbi:hypothetical protein LTR84_004897 [Exophiala bonariae]|uniref:BZIP domain-containing protein n=1 Tax=Exophiala bonariae TaxID=1690606 RepID=A0AAV9NQS6_9EURO|nr:hypothetical protein LTR84_004897 [Exophiala bonariae]
MSSDGSVRTSSAAKSKQERIRDNQRRSRARRQEYLAELERRLSECNITSREAELQRTAIVDLQSENSRLRALLDFAGVSPEVVDSFGREANQQNRTYPPTASLRHLKPKYASPDFAIGQSSLTGSYQEQSPSPTVQPPTQLGYPTVRNTSETYAILPDQASYSALGSSTPVPRTHHQPSSALHSTTYEWLDNSNTGGIPTPNEGTFNNSYQAPPRENHFYEPLHTLSPLSKAMLDRYSPNPAEMEEIRRRISMAYGHPKALSHEFQVHDHVLLQILNDMNAKAPEQ